MSERAVRFTLKTILGVIWVVVVIHVVSTAFPDADKFTPGQAGVLLGSVFLWSLTGVGMISTIIGRGSAVGNAQEPNR